MRIKRIQIKDGYKRFHNLTIDLRTAPARIVALVGPNGCGKSSVFDALLLLTTHQSGLIGGKGGRSNSYHSMHGSEYNAAKSITVDFEEGSFNEVLRVKREGGTNNTIFSFRSCYRYNSQVKISEARSVDKISFNNYGASVAADLDEKMELNYRRLHAKYNHYRDSTDSKPSDAKAKIIGDLNDSLTKCLALKIDSLGNIEADEGTLYFTKPDHLRPFEFNVLSAGEKEAVDILLDLYLRKDAYSDSVFIIDEPELHINTAIQRKLLVEMNRLIGKNCQLWIATHSAGFLRALQEDLKDQCQVIQFEGGTLYASQSIVLHPVRPTLQVWRGIFETALDDLAGLVSPKRIIYCEGQDKPGRDGEEKGLDAKVFNTIFSASRTDTQFVSSGGNTELDQRSAIALAILSKVFPSIEIWVLKDRDIGSGREITEQDRQLHLENNQKNHRVLRRWELENYLYDKEVLSAYCSSNNLTFDISKYNNVVRDIVNDDVKSQTGAIKSACGISTSISAARFKLNLAQVIRPEMAVYRDLEESIFSRK